MSVGDRQNPKKLIVKNGLVQFKMSQNLQYL